MARPLPRLLLTALGAALTVAAAAPPPGPAPPPAAPQRITARFSPKGGCAELVVWFVDSARVSVLVASYQWSSRPIHDAVVRAKARGLKVRVILDPTVEHAPLTADLVAAGFGDDALRIDDHHPIFHLKVIVRDGDVPALAAHEAGSYNFSAQAERNAENGQVVEGFPAVTAAFSRDLESHWAHARPRRAAP